MNDRTATLMRAKSKVDSKLTNYRISFVLDAQGQEKYYFTQATDSKATFFELRGGGHTQIDYADLVGGMAYELDADKKCGERIPIDDAEDFRGLTFHVAGHLLFMYEGSKDNMKRIGNEKMLGRDTTVYLHSFSNGEMRFWIDNEYGLALKYEQTGGQAAKVYVTEFTVGGVTVAGMVNIDEYDIE